MIQIILFINYIIISTALSRIQLGRSQYVHVAKLTFQEVCQQHNNHENGRSLRWTVDGMSGTPLPPECTASFESTRCWGGQRHKRSPEFRNWPDCSAALNRSHRRRSGMAQSCPRKRLAVVMRIKIGSNCGDNN